MGRRGPSGTVTFRFTDIEGSTALWDVVPLAMCTALARHDALVTEAVAMHGGSVFASGGDGFAVAFPTALSGVGAAAAVQVVMDEEEWPADAPGTRSAPASLLSSQ